MPSCFVVVYVYSFNRPTIDTITENYYAWAVDNGPSVVTFTAPFANAGQFVCHHLPSIT